VVHWELQARDVQKQRAFYQQMFNWQISEDAVGRIPPGIGGPLPGPGGQIRQTDRQGVTLFIQVLDLQASLAKAEELGGKVLNPAPDFAPGRPTVAGILDPEGNRVMLVQQ